MKQNKVKFRTKSFNMNDNTMITVKNLYIHLNVTDILFISVKNKLNILILWFFVAQQHLPQNISTCK